MEKPLPRRSNNHPCVHTQSHTGSIGRKTTTHTKQMIHLGWHTLQETYSLSHFCVGMMRPVVVAVMRRGKPSYSALWFLFKKPAPPCEHAFLRACYFSRCALNNVFHSVHNIALNIRGNYVSMYTQWCLVLMYVVGMWHWCMSVCLCVLSDAASSQSHRR